MPEDAITVGEWIDRWRIERKRVVTDEMVERVVKARAHVIQCDDDSVVLSRGAIRAILEAALSREGVSR